MSALAISKPLDALKFDRGDSIFENPQRRAAASQAKSVPFGEMFVDTRELSDFIGEMEIVGLPYQSREIAGWGDALDTAKGRRPWVNEMLALGTLALGGIVCVSPVAANDYVRAQPRAAEVSAVRSAHEASISVRLERLRDGWGGPETVAPSEQIIADVASVSLAFERVHVEPDIEVDEDGTVALEWFSGDEVLCLTFVGDGTVIGTISPSSPDYPGWKVRADDESALADYLTETRLKGFVRPA